MKKCYLSLLASLMAMLVCLPIHGQLPGETFKVDGLNYKVWNLNEKTVQLIPAFENYTNVSDLVIPDKVVYKGVTFAVTEVVDGAFEESSLTSVVIPASVKKIGSNAFNSSANLTTVTFNEGLEELGSYVFSFTKIRQVPKLPKSLNIIGSNIFDGTPWAINQKYGEVYIGDVFYCYFSESNLHPMPERTEITLKPGTRIICGNACSRQHNLVKFTMPESVISVGPSAFASCKNLSDITISPNIVYCGEEAFERTKWLNDQLESDKQMSKYLYVGNVCYKCLDRKVVNCEDLKEGTTMISSNAFANCPDLQTVTFPESVNLLGTEAFYNCEKLNRVTLSDKIKTIHSNAFELTAIDSLKLPALLEEIIDDSWEPINMNLRSLHIPANLNSIPNFLLNGSATKSYSVHPDNALYCASDGVLMSKDKKTLLKFPGGRTGEFTILEGVTDLAREAFAESNLTTVVIPTFIERLPDRCFANCPILENVIFEEPSSLKEIGDEAFYNDSIKSIKLPESLRRLGNSVFEYCELLEEIGLPDKLEYVGPGSFEYTRWYANQPDGVIYLNTLAYNIKGDEIQDLVIKDGTRVIGGEFGIYSQNLKSVTIPNSVKRVNAYAFTSSGVEKVVGGENAVMDNWVLSKTPWFDAQPAGMVYYGISALGYNGWYSPFYNLTFKEGTVIVNLNNGHFEPDSYLPNEYNISSIELPKSVRYIGTSAFDTTYGLNELIIWAPTPPEFIHQQIKDVAMEFLFDRTRLTVPLHAVEAYRNHPIWGLFKTIVGDPTGIDEVEQDGAIKAGAPDAPMYNLMGQRISEPYNGQIYIQNGQKKIWKK